MSRLPTVGSDNGTWGTVLNDFLDASFGFYRLSAATIVGATTINVDRIPGTISANAGHYIVIDPFTIEAELRLVTGVSGKTLTVAALEYAHANSDYVYFITGTQGTLIPWTWWGGKGNANSADATNNVTAFNRLSTQIHAVSGHGIGVDGTFCVNNQLTPYESQAIIGTHTFASKIAAVSGFPFDSTGDVAVIHPQRGGSGPVLYRQEGPSGRWWFRNIWVDGGNLANSNGIISSPQQPDSTENVRISNCAGKYGLSLNDVQYHDLRNLQFDTNYCDMQLWGCAYMRFYNMAITSTQGPVSINLESVSDSSFYGALVESMLNQGILFNIIGGSSRLGLYDIYTTGPGAAGGTMFYVNSQDNPTNASTYVITNARCSFNDNGTYILQDVQRSVTVNSDSDTQRTLPFFIAHGGFAYGLLAQGMRFYGPAGYTGAQYGPAGPRDISGSGTPQGAIAAPVGSTYRRTDGGANTSLYVKESGTGTSGWVGK